MKKKPEIINSDQGCQFTSDNWISFFRDQGIKISMTGKGRCLDNVYIERFWRNFKQEKFYFSIVERAAQLICTSAEFKDLWGRAMPKSWSPDTVVINPIARNKLRAELDGMIAHMYNMTEDEFAYILSTFPLVATAGSAFLRQASRPVANTHPCKSIPAYLVVKLLTRLALHERLHTKRAIISPTVCGKT